MARMYLITLYFDEKTTKELQRWIRLVAEATGNGFMQENHVPPHMTLGAFEAPEEETARRLFAEMNLELGGEVQLVSVGAFVPRVLYVSAVYSEYLHGLAKRVYQVLSKEPMVKIRPDYRPFSWLPHVTMGKQLEGEEPEKAFAVLQKEFHVLKGNVVRVGLSCTGPYRDLGSRELTKEENVW